MTHETNKIIHLAYDIVSKCGLVNQYSTTDLTLVTCLDCCSTSHHPGTEKTGHPVTQCTERNCATRCPSCGLTESKHSSACRRKYNKEQMPAYQDPLSVLWLMNIRPISVFDLPYTLLVEAKTQGEAYHQAEARIKQCAPGDTIKTAIQLSTINFNDCAAVFKI